MATAKRKTTNTKTDTKGAGVAPAITITEAQADTKRKQAHKDNMTKVAKANGKDIQQGKALNTHTYEYACTDCLDKVATMGDIYCIYDKPLNETGKCSCGNLTTTKAILF